MSAGHLTRIVVLAKAPVAGRSKTRLTPPYTSEQAAAIAQACLQDTIDTVLSLTSRDHSFDALVCLDGAPGPWLPPGVPVIPQCPGGHDVRIAHAISSTVQPAGLRPAQAVLLIGMDTPQVTTALLQQAAREVRAGDAALGPAHDGGWWLLGLAAEQAAVASDLIAGIPTSTPHTGELQLRRLRERSLRVAVLPVLTDIDTAADIDVVLEDVSGEQSAGRFARTVAPWRDGAAA